MKPEDRITAIEFRQDMQMTYIQSTGWICCLNCMWSTIGRDGEFKQCAKYKMVPPVSVIILSCNEWEADIPF